MGNCDPYSDSPEPLVVKQPKFTRVEEPTLLCNQVQSWQLHSGESFDGGRYLILAMRPWVGYFWNCKAS
jgi:hypothetical protein